MNSNDFKSQFPFNDYFKNKTKINIKFFAGMIPNVHWNNQLWINPSSWFLKCFYDLNGNFPERLNWLDPQLNDKNLSTDDFIKIIQDEEVDIICLGLYLWNHDRYINFGKKLKQLYPNKIIIVGGPEISAQKDPNKFWDLHNFIDLVVYGDGEIAFKNIIDSMIDANLATDDVYNIIFKFNSQSIDCGYKRFDDKTHKYISPYIHNKESIIRTVKKLRIDNDINLLINWEITRGCPFQCSFCDWSSGLHHKTYRKTYDFNKDLEFFSSIDLVANWIDANIGIFKEDEDIVNRSLELQAINKNFKLNLSNYSKVKKDIVYNFIEKVEKANPSKEIHTIAIQDINESVLKNISRPDISWSEHKEILVNLKQKYPQIKLAAETIIGLPGQTVESYKNMLLEFASVDIDNIFGSLFNLLPNSPAASIDYQNQFNLKFDMLGYMHSMPNEYTSLVEIKDNLSSCSWTKSNFIVSTISATFADLIIMLGMTYFYNHYSKLAKQNNWQLNSKTLVKILNSDHWYNFGQFQSNFINKNSIVFGYPMIMIQNDSTFSSFYEYFAEKNNWLKIHNK